MTLNKRPLGSKLRSGPCQWKQPKPNSKVNLRQAEYTTLKDDHDSHGHNGPSQAQKKDALVSAMECGCDRMVRRLLVCHGGMDLDIHVFPRGQTPLMWATEQENMDLVSMFLAHGADESFNFAWADYRVAIDLAVEKKSRELVEVLVQKTNRVLCTRALRADCGSARRRNGWTPPQEWHQL